MIRDPGSWELFAALVKGHSNGARRRPQASRRGGGGLPGWEAPQGGAARALVASHRRLLRRVQRFLHNGRGKMQCSTVYIRAVWARWSHQAAPVPTRLRPEELLLLHKLRPTCESLKLAPAHISTSLP